MKGTLYGVGVGPGDTELLTLKAVRIINETKYLAIPGTVKENTVAFNIVKPIIENPDDKAYMEFPMPMTKDRKVLDDNYTKTAEAIMKVLDDGEDVAFLTIGDPTVYATYMYVHQRVDQAGYNTEIVSGITSFCASAARLNMSLVERSEMLHVVPSSYDIDMALKLPGTKVLMKAASCMGHVKEELMKMDADVAMVENCGMATERIFRSAEEIDENAGYLSLIVVKDKSSINDDGTEKL